MAELLPILEETKRIFLAEPTLLEVEVPCVVIGDIHGQVLYASSFTRLLLFRLFGMLLSVSEILITILLSLLLPLLFLSLPRRL